MPRLLAIAAHLGGGRFLMTRIERALDELRTRGGIPLRVRLWDGRSFDLSPEPPVTVTLREPAVVADLIGSDLCTLAEALIDGRIEAVGPTLDIVRAGEALARAADSSRGSGLPRAVRRQWRHSKNEDADAIRRHYDVSNDFYALWLDREMIYSCAYFRSGDEGLDIAQRQKLDHICRKLMLKPGERLLDIGCGWGALVRHAAREYGVSATGITLSQQQFDYASARIGADGLADSCHVLLEDYRDHAGAGIYDKIVSVGMFEHVGIENFPTYFGVVARLLRTGGLFLNHGITSTDVDGRAVGLGGGVFIGRHIFPGGELAHLTKAVREIGAAGLEVRDVESLREHYALTLRHWTGRLEAAAGEACALVGERTLRTWLLYLAGCAHAFARNWVSVYQILAAKTDNEGLCPLPWTRAHLYIEEEEEG